MLQLGTSSKLREVKRSSVVDVGVTSGIFVNTKKNNFEMACCNFNVVVKLSEGGTFGVREVPLAVVFRVLRFLRL